MSGETDKLTNGGKPHVCGWPAVHKNGLKDRAYVCSRCDMPVDRPEKDRFIGMSDSQDELNARVELNKMTKKLIEALDRTQGGEWWEGELNKQIKSSSFFCGCYEGDLDGLFPDAMKYLESFIRSVLREERERLAKGVEGMKKYLPKSIDLEIDAMGAAQALRDQGYNQALSDAVKLIRKTK